MNGSRTTADSTPLVEVNIMPDHVERESPSVVDGLGPPAPLTEDEIDAKRFRRLAEAMMAAMSDAGRGRWSEHAYHMRRLAYDANLSLDELRQAAER